MPRKHPRPAARKARRKLLLKIEAKNKQRSKALRMRPSEFRRANPQHRTHFGLALAYAFSGGFR